MCLSSLLKTLLIKYTHFLFFVSVLLVGVYVHRMCALFQRGSEEGIRGPGTGVRHAWGQPCGCWKLNLGTLREQQGLRTSGSSVQTSVLNRKALSFYLK